MNILNYSRYGVKFNITPNGWDVYVVFLFGNLKTYSYLCKKITYTPCYVLVSVVDHNVKMIDLRTGCDTGFSM